MNAVRTLDEPQVQALGGTGRWFRDNVDWIHWGPLGLRSAEALFTYLTQENLGTIGNPGTSSLNAAMLQADIAYSQRFRRSRLIWQYSPRIVEVDGKFSWQLANQDSTFDLLFAPTSRMTVGITDWFSYYGQDNILNDRSFARNSYSGYLINPFLNNGQQTLMNSVALPVTYAVSARTRFSVSPFFNYAQIFDNGNSASAAPGTQTADHSTRQIGARTDISHTFSARQAMGIFYTYQVGQESGAIDTTSYIQSFGLTAERQIGRSFLLSGELGGSRSNANDVVSWTGVGTVTLSKSWLRSSAEVTYGRDASFSGLVGNGYSDYGWANYSREFGSKVNIGAAFGYLSGPSLGQHARGKYVTGTFSYGVVRNISWFFSYGSFWQSGGSPQLNAGNQMQYQTGLRWTPARRTGREGYTHRAAQRSAL